MNDEKIKKLIKIGNYKKFLIDTDYQAIKFAEGELTAKEYAPIKEQRQKWRNEINQLEKQIEELNQNL